MADTLHDQSGVEDKFWTKLDEVKIGMLGVVGPHHLQPMTGFAERDGRKIWFFTRKDTDLVQNVGSGAHAMFCLVDGHEFYACVGGELIERCDRERMDRYWNPRVAAWYPEGKDDPELTMLCLDVHDAQVWIQAKGPTKFAYEIAKANATHTLPNVGERANLNFQ